MRDYLFKIFNSVVPHKRIMLLALAGFFLITGIYSLRPFLIERKLQAEGKIYVPVTFFAEGDEAVVYMPFIEDVKDGVFPLSDPSLKEHAGEPSMMSASGPLVMGMLWRAFGLNGMVWIADMIFPGIIFLLAFFILFLITQSPFVSFALSFIFMFARDVASLAPFSMRQQFFTFAAYFKPVLADQIEAHISFDRFLTPAWTFIPLGLFLLFWLVSLRKENTCPAPFLKSQSFVTWMPTWFHNIFLRICRSEERCVDFWSIIAGFFYGTLLYSYPFDWIGVSLVLGNFLFISWWRMDYFSLKRAIAVIGVGAFISIPYWINYEGLVALPFYREALERIHLEHGRFFRLFMWPHFVLWLGSALWLLSRRARTPLLHSASAIFFAAFFSMNIQILTGFVPQPSRFLNYTFAFLLFVAYAVFLNSIYQKFKIRIPLLRVYVIAVLVIGVLLTGVRSVRLQMAYAEQNYWRYTLEKPEADALRWISEHAGRDDVFLTPSVYSNTNLSMYTSVYTFFPANGILTMASNAENIERFIISAKIFGAADNDVRQLFDRDYFLSLRPSGNVLADFEKKVAGHLHHRGLNFQGPNSEISGDFKWADFSGVEAIAQAVLDEWRRNPATLLQKYEFDYVYAGPLERGMFSFDPQKTAICLDEVYNSDGISIYKKCTQ